MPIPCKVCDSEHKDSIESMILNGESNNAIAKEMQARGMAITHAAVNRHKKAHMKEHEEMIKELATPKSNTKYDRNFDLIPINAIERLDKALKTKNNVRKFRQINDYIIRLFVNQITIVLDTQKKFMMRESKYPYEEIRGLHIINEILIRFENFIQTLPAILPIDTDNKSLYERVQSIHKSMIDGKISIENANKLLAGLTIIAKVYETDILEKRVTELENK